MKRNWIDFKSLHSNIEGARAAFEKACETTFRKLYRNKNVQIVKSKGGDGGIDIFIGNLNEKITVIQCKFFLSELGESQKAQIRKSFNTIIKSQELIVDNWILCLPTELILKEHQWWSNWTSKEIKKHLLPTGYFTLINGNELIQLMKETGVYNQIFQIDEAIKINEIHKIVSKSQNENTTNHIVIDYMRLFGAVEVPLLLKIIEKNRNVIPFVGFGESDDGDGYLYYTFDNEKYPIQRDLANFWINEWKYKGAFPIMNSLWEKFSGSRIEGISLYWTALKPIEEDIIQFSYHGDIDEDGSLGYGIADDFDRSFKDYPEDIGMNSEGVGFTFIVLKNSYSEHMSDINIRYSEIENPSVKKYPGPGDTFGFRKYWKDISTENKSLSDIDYFYENLINIRRKRIANLDQGESIIWLINVFRADEDKLPEVFLENITIPIDISYFVNGKEYHQKIRRPYYNEAARLIIPSGWFGQ